MAYLFPGPPIGTVPFFVFHPFLHLSPLPTCGRGRSWRLRSPRPRRRRRPRPTAEEAGEQGQDQKITLPVRQRKYKNKRIFFLLSDVFNQINMYLNTHTKSNNEHSEADHEGNPTTAPKPVFNDVRWIFPFKTKKSETISVIIWNLS